MSHGEGLVLVNGPENSVQGPRARSLFENHARIVYKDRGRIGSIRSIAHALKTGKPSWIYCIDLGVPAAPLAALYKRQHPDVRLLYEIGDPARPLFANQAIPGWQVALADWMDRHLPAVADHLVFRGSYLAEYFAGISPKHTLGPWTWLPDGVNTTEFRPRRDDPEVAALRREHGLVGRFVVGLVGSIHHNPIHNLFYGWEISEALARIPADAPITGVVVGDGPGRSVLERTRERLGLGDRLRLVGRVSHDRVPLWMNVFDVGLSTQTDDPVGWGRTTAKLPEYLACGTAVLCTDVGEAHRWLGAMGQTLPYTGMRDEAYPERLATRLVEWSETDLTPIRERNRDLALRVFDYEVLRRRVRPILAGETSPEPDPATLLPS